MIGLAFVQVVVGDAHVCGRTEAGEVACWGAHHRGQLGLPDVPLFDERDVGTMIWSPRRVDLGAVTVEELAAAWDHTCARFRAGRQRRAACWGEGSPVPVDLGLDDVSGIRTGTDQVCALRGRRKVTCFGWSDDGTLSPLPEAVETAYTARTDWGCEVQPDGAIGCWADGPASWRLDHQPTRTWRYGVDCPEGTVTSLTSEAWTCLDAQGRRQGPSATFWPDGRTRDEGAFRDDLRVGPWQEWDASGRERTSGSYVDDRRDGTWTRHRRIFLGPELLIVEGAFAGGVPVGRWTFEGGRTVTYEDGHPIGWTLGRTALGRDVEGAWWRTELAPDGTVLARAGTRPPSHRPAWGLETLAGVPVAVLHGPYEGRHGDVTVSGQLADGRPVGRWRGTRADGPAWEGAFVDGKPDGPWKSWHADGTVALSGLFATGLPDGPWERRYPGGALAVEGRYDRGLFIGRWRWLRPDGTVYLQREFVRPSGLLAMAYDARTGQPVAVGIGEAALARGPDTLMEEIDALVDIEPYLDCRGSLQVGRQE